MHPPAPLGTCQSGSREFTRVWGWRRRLIERLRRRGRCPDHSSSDGNREAEEWQAESWGRLLRLSRAASGLRMASAERFRQARRPINENPAKNRVRCPTRAAARPSRSQSAPPPGCGFRGSEHGQRISSVELRPPGSSHGQPPSPSPQRSWPKPRPSADPAVASELDELGPVAIVPLCSRRRARAGSPQSLRTATGGGAARKSSDLESNRPRGRGNSTGRVSVSIGKRPERIRFTSALDAEVEQAVCQGISGVGTRLLQNLVAISAQSDQLLISESGGGWS